MAADWTELARRAKAGDEASFRELYRRASPKVRGTLRHLVGIDGLDDLEQEVFLRVWRHLPKLRDNAAFSTWLYRLTWNVAMDARKELAVSRGRITDGVEVEAVGDSSRAAARTDSRIAVERALARLDPLHRAVLVLVELEELPQQEVAEILEVPLGTVKSRLFHARTQVRAALEKEDE